MRTIVCAITIAVTLATAQVEANKKPKPANNLRGSRSSQLRQNGEADKEDLTRINEKELAKYKKAGLLVPLPERSYLRIDDRIESNLRFCRPQTAKFLLRTSEGYNKQFDRAIQVNSAVRTVEHQEELRSINGNAAKVRGPTASSHLTGSTVDIAKLGMSRRELSWMRSYLSHLEKLGYIEATEEFRQQVFHIMVFKKYLTYGKLPPARKPKH